MARDDAAGSTDPLAVPAEAIRRLYAYVAYRIGPGADAEDVVSDTIERAIRFRRSFDPAKGSPAAWLVGIAAREIADHVRRRARQDMYGLEPPEGYVDDLAARSALHLDLVRGLGALDARDRELIALRYGADLPSKEIAELLRTSPNAVDVGLHRALARIRAVYERTDGPVAVPAASDTPGSGPRPATRPRPAI